MNDPLRENHKYFKYVMWYVSLQFRGSVSRVLDMLNLGPLIIEVNVECTFILVTFFSDIAMTTSRARPHNGFVRRCAKPSRDVQKMQHTLQKRMPPMVKIISGEWYVTHIWQGMKPYTKCKRQGYNDASDTFLIKNNGVA